MRVPILLSAYLTVVGSQFVPVAQRVDCHPEPGVSAFACLRRGCEFDRSEQRAFPCYFPEGSGYQWADEGSPSLSPLQEGVFNLVRNKENPSSHYGGDFDELTLTVNKVLSGTRNGKRLALTLRPANGDSRFNPFDLLPTGKEDGEAPQAHPNYKRETPLNHEDELDLELVRRKGAVGSFQVRRRSTKRALFDTRPGGLVYSDQFLQIAAVLPSDNVYGFGENVHKTLKHDMSQYKTWPILARDQFPVAEVEQHKNYYGTHPFYMVVEPDGKAHGVFFVNSNAQEYSLGPGPMLTYRTIGGTLDMMVFPGPKPNDVIRQYHDLIGYDGGVMLPAYWALGYQICRYGYTNTENVRQVVDRTRAAGIPYDVQYVDIDYMNANIVFTVDEKNFKDLPEYMARIRREYGLKAIFMFDPAMQVDTEFYSALLLKHSRSLLEWPDEAPVPAINEKYSTTRGTQQMLGMVWPWIHVGFPDYTMEEARQWWSEQIRRFHDQKMGFDGMWIDMNEPAVFGTNEAVPWYWGDKSRPEELREQVPLVCPEDNKLDSPPYETWATYYWTESGEDRYARLSSKTICLSAKMGFDTTTGTKPYNLYDTKNLYGTFMAYATRRAMNQLGKRGVVVGRSTYPTAGRWKGHWLGDNHANWADLRAAIIGAIEFNFFGVAYVGSDVCGFNGNSEDELCARWHQMAAFHPYYRNHNGKGNKPQDPARPDWKLTAPATKLANELRYTYLPFLYSLFFESALEGGSVIRPLFFEYPQDSVALNVDQQFLWGSQMMISPALYPGAQHVEAYFPDDNWYSIYDRNYGQRISEAGWVTLEAPLRLTEEEEVVVSQTPVHVRGGSILPRQPHAVTTTLSRENPFELLIAIDQSGEGASAFGSIYWDDGESIYSNYSTLPAYFYRFFLSFETTEETAKLVIAQHNVGDPTFFPMPHLDVVELLGYAYEPVEGSFLFDGQPMQPTKVESDKAIQKVLISSKDFINLSALPRQAHTLQWRHTTA